jgi:hypothetical protein
VKAKEDEEESIRRSLHSQNIKAFFRTISSGQAITKIYGKCYNIIALFL